MMADYMNTWGQEMSRNFNFSSEVVLRLNKCIYIWSFMIDIFYCKLNFDIIFAYSETNFDSVFFFCLRNTILKKCFSKKDLYNALFAINVFSILSSKNHNHLSQKTITIKDIFAKSTDKNFWIFSFYFRCVSAQ